MSTETKINNGVIANLLDWAYGKAISGFAGVDSAYELANSYLIQDGSLSEQVDSLIKWQVAKSATSGFTMGVGGLMTMPLTVPANIASVIYVQIRMICAIAHMGGYDIRNDKVKTFVYICLVGNGAKELLKNITVKVGEKAILKVITATNQKVSTRIAAKVGEKGTVSLGKAVPILGGVVGGTFDALSTRVVGKVAKELFIINKNTGDSITPLIEDVNAP